MSSTFPSDGPPPGVIPSGVGGPPPGVTGPPPWAQSPGGNTQPPPGIGASGDTFAQGKPGPPPGITPNFINPPSRKGMYLGPGIIFCILALFFVGLRLWVKKRVVKRMTWDDLLIVIAVHFALAQTILNVVLIEKFELGLHIWDIPYTITTGYDKNLSKDLTFVASMLYILGIMFAKVSLLMLFLAIFSIKRWFRWFCYGMMAFVVAYSLLFFIMLATYCNPPEMTWKSIGWTKPGKCLDVPKMYWANGGLNIVTDVVLMIMPLPLVFKLQMSTRKKWGLAVILGTASFTIIAAVVREIIIIQSLQGFDQTWIYIPTVLWLSIELDVGIICTCLPTLRPLHRSNILDKLIPPSLRSWISSRISSLSSHSHSRGSKPSEKNAQYHSADSESDVAARKQLAQMPDPARTREECCSCHCHSTSEGSTFLTGSSSTDDVASSRKAAHVKNVSASTTETDSDVELGKPYTALVSRPPNTFQPPHGGIVRQTEVDVERQPTGLRKVGNTMAKYAL